MTGKIFNWSRRLFLISTVGGASLYLYSQTSFGLKKNSSEQTSFGLKKNSSEKNHNLNFLSNATLTTFALVGAAVSIISIGAFIIRHLSGIKAGETQNRPGKFIEEPLTLFGGLLGIIALPIVCNDTILPYLFKRFPLLDNAPLKIASAGALVVAGVFNSALNMERIAGDIGESWKHLITGKTR